MGRQGLFQSWSKRSKGVAILFDPKLTVKVKKEIKSDDGTIITLETNIDDEISVLVNIYAPKTIFTHSKCFFKNFQRCFGNKKKIKASFLCDSFRYE